MVEQSFSVEFMVKMRVFFVELSSGDSLIVLVVICYRVVSEVLRFCLFSWEVVGQSVSFQSGVEAFILFFELFWGESWVVFVVVGKGVVSEVLGRCVLAGDLV